MSTRLDISQLRGRAPSKRTDSSRKWQVESGGERAWVALELLPKPVVEDDRRLADWIERLTVEARPGIADWEVFERLDPKAARGLGIAGHTVIAARRWVEGRSLGRSSSVSRWRDTGAAVAMSLRELHDQGAHHGALKPANIVMEGPDRATITDLPLSPTPYDDPTRLASIAPYLAPECWEGDGPRPASDIYALGVMLGEFATGRRPLMANGLSGWSRAHISGAPRVDHLSDTGLTELVERMLEKRPEDRPTAGEVISQLEALGAEVRPLPVAPLTRQIRRTARSCAERLERSVPTHLTIARQEQSDASHRIADLVADRLQLAARPTIFLSGSVPEPGWPWGYSAGPWGSLREIARAVSRLGGRELRDVTIRGDQKHRRREFGELILEQLPEAGLRVVWSDFDDEVADVRDIWQELVDASARRGRPLCTLTVTDEPMPRAEPVGIEATAAAWDDWRRSSARTELRRMSSAAWREAVSQGSRGLDAMKSALDRQLGAGEEHDSPEPGSASADLSSIERLAKAGALREACIRSRDLWRGRHDTDLAADDILDHWANAAVLLGEQTPAVEALEKLLVDRLRRDDAETDLAVDLARLRIAQGRSLEALQALNRARPRTAAEIGIVHRWKAQANLDAGRYLDAADAASEGLDHLDEAAQPEMSDTLVLSMRAAKSAAGEPGAADSLEDALAESGASLEPTRKAQMFRFLGRGRTAQNEYDEAIAAYRRALDIVDTANLDAQIPHHRLRLGSAYHRRGQLGLAREHYVRGIEASDEQTSAETCALLHAQLAVVDGTLGALEGAERHLWSARDIADRQHLDTVLVVCDLLEGDIYLAQGEPERARECYQRALRGRRPTSAHQRTELHLAAADAALEAADPDAARRHVDAARDLIDEESIDELRPRLLVMRGKLDLQDASAPSMAAIEAYRKGLEGALGRHDLRYVLRQAPPLIAVLRREGIGETLGQVADVYTTARRSVSMGLTRELRETFEANVPELDTDIEVEQGRDESPETQRQVREQAPAPAPAANRELKRLLSFNEVLFGVGDASELAESSLDAVEAVLGVDAAVVVLDAVEEKATAARILCDDGERAWPTEGAEELAREVARFGQSSTTREPSGLALLCLPIRDARGVMGALVLGRIDGAEAMQRELAEAVAHQVALAFRQLAERAELARKLDASLGSEQKLRRAVERLEARVAELDQAGRQAETTRRGVGEVPHSSQAMEGFLSRLRRSAQRDMPVELVGPAGSRRETYARMLHEEGPRRDGSLVVVDCGAFDASSLEVELFGELTPRFERRGALQLADAGTLLLDRIDRVPRDLQSKLYRALVDGAVRPLGAENAVSIDVRPVVGTESPLMSLVEGGDFAADLGHWLSAETLEIPPLSERVEDIPLLAADLLQSLSVGQEGLARLTADAAVALREARWPGDVRQLESVIRAATALAGGDEIGADTVATLVEERSPAPQDATSETRGRKPKASRAAVISAMQRAGDDRSQAAELLGVSERTLYRYLNKYELR
ncbi:MAG: sigma 54-interacting transcriptional regulator [Myxococcota bacterium]